MTPTQERVRKLVHSAHLPTLPSAYQRLLKTLDDPTSNGERVASVLRADPGLTARVLKVSNNAAFGHVRRIESVAHAVAVLGTNRIRHLALAGAVLGLFKGIPPHLLDVRRFWEHSLAVAFAAEGLGRRLGMDAEALFVSGLLHDLGVLVLCANQPADARRVLTVVHASRRQLHEVEQTLLGFDHNEVGEELLSSWGLTAQAEVARWHHAPEVRRDPAIDVVHLADVLATELRMGSLGENVPHELSEGTLLRVGLTGHELDLVIRDLRSEWGQAVGMFLG